MAKRNSKKAARAAEKVAKKHPKLFTFLLVILVIALIAAACYYFFVYRKQHQGGSGGSPEVVGGNVTEIASADLSIHFIAPAVKASGDSALIKVGNTEVLIDAGPNKTNTTEIADYLGAYCTDGVLEYVIATHSDSDHIAGFVGSSSGGKRNGILYTYNVGTIIQFDQVTEETSLLSGILRRRGIREGTGNSRLYGAAMLERIGRRAAYILSGRSADDFHEYSV